MKLSGPVFFNALLIITITLALTSCMGGNSADDVREETKEAYDKAEKHIRKRTEEYDKLLKNRLDKVNERIDKLEDVSKDARPKLQDDLSNPIVTLRNEKEMLELEMKTLQYRTDSSVHMLHQEWTNYEAKLNIVLNDLNTRYNRIKEEKE